MNSDRRHALSLVEVIEHDHFYTHESNEERKRNWHGQFEGKMRKPSQHEDTCIGHDHSYSNLLTSSSTSDYCEMCIDENDSESDECEDEDSCTYNTEQSVKRRHIVELDVLAEGLEKGIKGAQTVDKHYICHHTLEKVDMALILVQF
ncbi:uncharacterized protein LOC133171806 [Saccostrea echinata]|uniref:uncharacterized protein LOC133171806 n=1 Tax=Saccostrea echinata TaxID=191078 RepID=UPI002A7FE45D|nr:uncharacterized protein LOC133171806 [Saccostrea echinata]